MVGHGPNSTVGPIFHGKLVQAGPKFHGKMVLQTVIFRTIFPLTHPHGIPVMLLNTESNRSINVDWITNQSK